MPISPAQLKASVYRTGNYVATPGGPGGPALRTPTNVPFNGQTFEHFIAQNSVVTYAEGPDPGLAGARRITFSAAGTHNLAVYLPYRDNNISSAVVGPNISRFFTDTLSGCTIFVDRHPGGGLVVYHANVQGGAAAPTPQQAQDVSFEKYYAIHMKRQLHRAAAAHYGAAPAAELFKSTYNRRAVGRMTYGGSPLVALGTTVVGFKTGAGWEFWFQTWARNLAGQASIVETAQFAVV